MTTVSLALSAATALLLGATPGTDVDHRPVELGRIEWLRDYDRGMSIARQTDKPVMLLFDEVPGCHTCTSFGNGPLSHPIVVDAAGQLFVPIAVYNNVTGDDAAVLKRFKEPAMNNPVIRWFDAEGKELVTRKEAVYTTGALLERMVLALKTAGKTVPPYLTLVSHEYHPAETDTATFAMHCYWVGEQKLGALHGVLATRIGSLDGQEVVELDYDPTVLPYTMLVDRAKKFDCAQRVFARTDAQWAVARSRVGEQAVRTDQPVDTSTTQQHDLAGAPDYHYLPLTQLQATRINAAIASKQDPTVYLSPGQIKLHQRLQRLLRAKPDALKSVTPDRSPGGVIRYYGALEQLLRDAAD